MKAVFRLGKLAHPLIKLLGFHSFVSAVTSMGADKRFFFPLMEIDISRIGPLFHSLASTFARRSYYELLELINKEDYGFQGGLKKAYQTALDSTLTSLEEKCLAEHQDITPTIVKDFFENLEDDYSHQEELEFTDRSEVIDAFASHDIGSFEKLRDAVQLDLTLPEAKILKSFTDSFPEVMQQAFLEQLLDPTHEQANIDFIFYLIEHYLHAEYRKQKIGLREVSYLLNKVVVIPIVGSFHRKEAQRLLESVKEALHKKVSEPDEVKLEFASTANEAIILLPLYLPGDDKDSITSGRSQLEVFTPSFIGRAMKLKDLHSFVRIKDKAFHWGGLLASTGTGKNRLVVEFCQQIRKFGFSAGFLRPEHLSLLMDYQPLTPTLVVLDGVAAIYKQVIKVIEHMYQRRHSNVPLANNFRLLLLDRDRYDSWWGDFKVNSLVKHSSFKESSCVNINRNWFGMAEKERWQIIQVSASLF